MTTIPNENERWISDRQVGERLGIHRKSVWQWVKEGSFPAPVKLSRSVTRWRLSDVTAWEAKREKEAV
jgi:predicted DNA-binding transcriptional regulator AlpA